MLKEVQESKLTYLAFGIIAGYGLWYCYNNWQSQKSSG